MPLQKHYRVAPRINLANIYTGRPVFSPADDKSRYFGKSFRALDGTIYKLISQNDLCVGYWSKIVRGRAQKTLYCADALAPASFWEL